MLIKICGITNLEDARLAIDAGATALGFNFWRPSKRFIEPAAARAIIDQLPAAILKVGVFVNEASPQLVEQIAAQAGVSAVQLHGDESPDFCKGLAGRHVLKVLGVGVAFDPTVVLSYNVNAIMLDAFDPKNRGGTGQQIDWSIARRVREMAPRLILAGGLSPENVAAAITAVEPHGVDACSALEQSPGKKSPERVRLFVRNVLAASWG